MLLNGLKCESCKVYRAYLRKSYARWSQRCCEELTDVSSHTNIRYMNTPEKKSKMSKLKKRVEIAKRDVLNLEKS